MSALKLFWVISAVMFGSIGLFAMVLQPVLWSLVVLVPLFLVGGLIFHKSTKIFYPQ